MADFFKKNDESNIFMTTIFSGLKIYYIPKPEYKKTIAMLTVNFGSTDTECITTEGIRTNFPYGTAHFLEHKLFEKKDTDLFSTFYSNNAIPSAFTSYTKTSYLFSTQSNILDNLHNLLELIQNPYFSDQSLKKERKIIKQEIRMYNDQIENNLLLGILHNMYGVHPISSQICGTEKSIENITVETLYRAFDNFYHPKNMYLLVIGRIDIHKLIELVEIKQKNSQKYTKTYSKKLLVNSPKKKQLYPIKMDITQEYFIIGFKGNKSLPEDYLQIYKYKVSIQLLLEILLGQFSTSVEILNHSRMITQNLVFDFCLDEPFHFATILSSSKDANKVVDYLYNIFITFDKNSDLNELSLNLAKKKLLGNFLSAQNSLDELCIKFQDNLYGEYTYLDMASIIELINLQDLISWGKTLFTPDNFNTFYIYPLH